MSIPVPDAGYPEHLMNTVKVTPVSPMDLRIPKALTDGEGAVRTLDIQPGGLVAREGRAVPKVSAEHLVADPLNDLLKIVFVERISGRGETFVGFVGVGGRNRGVWPPPYAGMPVPLWASAKTMRIWPRLSTM